jgi:ElaB/YqjD/DUF883 family membrane-anchored ribosome-binding protein
MAARKNRCDRAAIFHNPRRTIMETTKSAQESGKTSGYGTATTSKKSDGPSSEIAGSSSETAGSILSAQIERGEKIVNEVKETVTDAYDRTARGLNDGYSRAVDYGRSNPGKASLIIFGAGLGVGLLLANSVNSGSRSRRGRIVTPVMNALTDIATQLFR